ncbi:MAG: AraC family transcriptional regulator [Chlorobi bacterium]|nr:AraC family transcriptional regulator [Chlorobiota bacterium]
MFLQIHTPSAPLDYYIDAIWYSADDDFQTIHRTIPILHHELIFNFSDHFSVHAGRGTPTLVSNAGCWISGLHTIPTITRTMGRHEMVGVLFKPYGLRQFTGAPAAGFRNLAVSGAEIMGNDLESLMTRIARTAIINEKFSMLEDFLRSRCRAATLPDYIPHAVRSLAEEPARIGVIGALATDIGITTAAMIAAFNNHVGLPPLALLNLQRLNRVLADLAADPRGPLTPLAHRHGYFDQAHFIRHFRRATGMTPSSYKRAALAGGISPISPNSILLG